MNISLLRRSRSSDVNEMPDAAQTRDKRRFSPAALTSAWTAALVKVVAHGPATRWVQKGNKFLREQVVLKTVAAIATAAAKVERLIRQRTVTVTFDADAIRVVVLRGRTVLDWRTVYNQGSPWGEASTGGVCTPEAAAQLHAVQDLEKLCLGLKLTQNCRHSFTTVFPTVPAFTLLSISST